MQWLTTSPCASHYVPRCRLDPEILPRDFDPAYGDGPPDSARLEDDLFGDLVGCDAIKIQLRRLRSTFVHAEKVGRDPRQVGAAREICLGPHRVGLLTLVRPTANEFYQKKGLDIARRVRKHAGAQLSHRPSPTRDLRWHPMSVGRVSAATASPHLDFEHLCRYGVRAYQVLCSPDQKHNERKTPEQLIVVPNVLLHGRQPEEPSGPHATVSLYVSRTHEQ